LKAKLNGYEMRDLALFVVVAALVAVVGVVAGREVGLGERAAVAESEPLTLKLTATEQICETGRGYQESLVYSELDSGGNRSQREEVFGWTGIPSVPVAWNVSGGEAPYSLVIDNESAYRDDRNAGASGTATVGCADTSVGTSFLFDERLYAVDPGWKTVRGVVTDANGQTAEATATVYVLLDLGGGTTGDILRRGETYRVLGFLMTAPESFDVRVGGMAERECAENDPDPRCGDTVHGFSLIGTDAGISHYQNDGGLHKRRPDVSNLSGASVDPIAAAIDSMVDSLGKLPRGDRGSE